MWPALKVVSAGSALSYLQEAKRLCSSADLMHNTLEFELKTGIVLFHSGQISEAASSFVSIAKDALSKPGELYSLRRLIAATFYLAQIAHPHLPPHLFHQAVTIAATQPQTGFATRAAAQ